MQVRLNHNIDLSTLVIDPGGHLLKEWQAGQSLTVVRDDNPKASELIYYLGSVHPNQFVAERFNLSTQIDYRSYTIVEYYSWVIVVHNSYLEPINVQE